MQKQLLITISEDLSCLFGVRFVASFFSNKQSMAITLFYVAPPKPALPRGTRRSSPHPSRDHEHHSFGAAKEAMETSSQLLLDAGFDPSRITCKSISKQFGTVKDIVREARQGLYDAVVLGRRGYVLFEKTFGDSVSRAILDHDFDFPIWVCRQSKIGRKSVLLCTDGSSPSLRMADHVGFMLAEEPEHRVTVYHVETGDLEPAPNVLEATEQALMRNGLPKERIQCQRVRSRRVPKEIMATAERGNYGVVAVGRESGVEDTIRKWRVGSTSLELLKHLAQAALWVSK